MEVISTRRYEVRPPPTSNNRHEILDDFEDSVALVKEEEWETRKKKEITTTRQIETRVKRQVVLEDGEVIVDSGPFVTTNTTEDIEQQEHTTEERRMTGDQPYKVEWLTSGKGDSNGIVQKKLNETVVRSREETEERLETEDRQQLGDISDEAYQKAIQCNKGDLRIALAESTKQVASQTGPRIVQHTTRSNKVIDTEKTLEKQELKADGVIFTEKKKTVEHEEINDAEIPDDGSGGLDDVSETRKEGSQKFLKKREEDVVDYVLGGERIAREMRYVAETTEGERIGDWSPPPMNMRTTRLHKHTGFSTENTSAARKDALTKKPLDLEEEDEARKFETSKWLESHFGSESRSSHGSIDNEEGPFLPNTNTSFINVTMKSCSSRERENHNVNSSRHRYIANTGRESTSPSGYFHGISEWSERYHDKEKEGNHTKTSSPSQHFEIAHTVTNGHGHSREYTKDQFESTCSRNYESVKRREHQNTVKAEKQRTSSPLVRQKSKEQWHSKAPEKTSWSKSPSGRTVSPIHVIQRTWESRNQAGREQTINRDDCKKLTTRSRSNSPKQVRIVQDRKKSSSENSSNPSHPSKSTSQSKYKIGESFRKLVGKLRSGSTERKNKRGGNSISQITQTDDNGLTYMQYNVIDQNIPLFNDRETENRVSVKPPRSPRNETVTIKAAIPHKSTGMSQQGRSNYQQDITSQQDHGQRNDMIPPVHRYYLGEDPFGGSIYGREKGYRDTKRPTRTRVVPKSGGIEAEYSVATNSLSRLSKSTSRLTNAYEFNDQFRNVQTLPRNMRSEGRSAYSKQPSLASSRQQPHSANGISHATTPSKQYGSMINISIKNTVTSTVKPHHRHYTILQAPAKPERTYKSTLSRSKSFNVEVDKKAAIDRSFSLPYKSNLQLNRFDVTPPPLKSPAILVNIGRSNRDLFRASKKE